MASKKNEAKIRFTAETKDFNKAISKANGDMAEFRSELNLNQTEMKGMADTTDKLAERKEILAKQYVAAGEKTDALRKKMEVAARIYGENSSEAQKLKVAVNNAAAAQEKAWQELQATKKALKDQASASEDTRTSLEKLEDTITEQEDALEALRKEYANSVLENGKYDRKTKELSQSINELSGDLQKNKRKLSDAGGAAEKAGNEAAESAEGWTIVKDVIADMASDALAAAAEGFKELMLEGEAALDKLQVKTGLSAGAMEGIGDTAYDVFNNGWGESIDDVTESMSTVYTMMGDMDFDHLQQYTENAMTLSDVWGYDTAESIRAVNSLVNQFGLDAEDAFDLVVQGAQNGLDQNGDLLDTINEYSVQFARAGYSADDMFNMLMNGVAEGTWSVDKLGDAFKEYNIRVSDGTVADALMENRKALGLTKKEVNALTASYGKGGEEGQKAMKDTLDAVRSVEDETERYKLGVSLFGTMWEDLGEDAVVALFDTEGGIKATNDAMSQTKTDAYDNLATSISTLGRTLKNEIFMPVVDLITPAIKGIVDWCIENMEILKPIIIGVGTAFGVLAGALAISGIISGVQRAFALLNTTLLANPITLIIAAVAGLVAAFIYLWNNCEGFREFWINLWEIVTNAFDVAWAWIVNFFTVTLPAVWNTVTTTISEVWSSICSTISTWASEIWASVSTWFTNTKDSIVSAVSGAYDSAVQWFSNMWNTLTNTCSNIWSSVTSWFSKLKTNLATSASNIWSSVTSKFTSLKTSIVNVASNIWSAVTSKFSSLRSKASEIWSNIKSAIQKPIEEAKTFVGNMIDKIKGFFDFSWSLPPLKMPHITIKGKFDLTTWPIQVPKFGIEWYAQGGILNSPTIFGFNGNNAMVGGEAGAEAVAPIDVLLDYVRTAVQDVYHTANADRLENSANFSGFERVIDSIESFANRPIELYIDGKKFATATAGATDSVTGNRMNFRSRGLAIE